MKVLNLITLLGLSVVVGSCSHEPAKTEVVTTDNPYPFMAANDGLRCHLDDVGNLSHAHMQTKRRPASGTMDDKKVFEGDTYGILKGTPPPPPPADGNDFVQEMKITILSDMAVSGDTHAEWGFSALVEGKDAKGAFFSVLFDTGAEPETVWYNALKLGMTENICRARQVILSHNHQDHTAGLVHLREHCRKFGSGLSEAIIGGPDFFWSRFDVSNPTNILEVNYLKRPYFENRPDQSQRYDLKDPRYHRLDERKLEKGVFAEWYEADGGHFEVAERPKMIVPGVWTSGRIPRKTKFEIPFYSSGAKKNGDFVADAADGPMVSPDGHEYIDNIPEEHSLVINTQTGLVVIAGCGHAGIVNTVNAARYYVFTKKRPVIAVLGGYHLFKYPRKTLDEVADSLKTAGVHYIMGSHCTGFETIVYLRERLNAITAKNFKQKNGVITTIGTNLRTPSNSSEVGPLVWSTEPPALNNHRDLFD